jgi:tight adherence protein B
MRLRIAASLVVAVALTLALPFAASAESGAAIRKVDTSRFPQVAVTVSLPGTPALSGEDVQLLENGSPVSVDSVQPLGAAAIDVVLAIDASNSMKGKPIAAAVAAAKRFVQSLPDEARIAIVAFANSARVVVPLTTDRGKLTAALGHLGLQPGTALYDAVTRSASLFGRDDAQHNIVLLSDGANNVGTTDAATASASASQADATIFSVGVKGGETDVQTLSQLATDTGGTYQTADAGDLSALYTQLASGISDQYVIAYASEAQPGEQINVQMNAAGNPLTALVLAPTPHHTGPVQPEVRKVEPLLHGTLGLIVAIIIVFVALFLLGILAIGAGARLKRDRDAELRMRAIARPQQVDGADDRGAGWIPTPMVDVADRLVDAGGFGANLEHKLEQGGLAFRAGEFLAASVFAGLGGMVVGFILFQNLFVGLACGVIGGAGPWAFVMYKLNQRTEKLNQQLPEVLNVLASSLRAGHSFLQALDTAAKDIPEPAAGEFSRTVAEIRLGRPLDEAMNAMAERVGSENFRWAVLAVNIQREVGGNLAEILDTVANTVREREMLRREVHVLTTEGRLSMYILTALPILFAFYLVTTKRDYASLLWTTRTGLFMSVTAIAMLAVGFVWFKKIVRIDV